MCFWSSTTHTETISAAMLLKAMTFPRQRTTNLVLYVQFCKRDVHASAARAAVKAAAYLSLAKAHCSADICQVR
jgi:hypothetical protein